MALELDRVDLMPVCAPPHKTIEADPGVEHRVAMCGAAVADNPALGVSLVEVERGGSSYTIDTLRALRAQAPHDDLTWIMGGDQAHALPSWREPEGVLSLAWLGVAEREGLRRVDILASLHDLAGAPERIRFFDMPRIDLSSSLLRRRVAAGDPIRYLVPDAVRAHIEQERLYL